MTPREEVLAFVASMSNLNRAAFALAVARYAERRALLRAEQSVIEQPERPHVGIRALPSEYDAGSE